MTNEEAKVLDETHAVLAKLKVLECAMLELLANLDGDAAMVVAKGVRKRVNEWFGLAANPLTPMADEMASEQLSLLLQALGDAPQLPVVLDEKFPRKDRTVSVA